MASDSLVYSLIQIIHNLNAVIVLGAPLFGLWYGFQQVDRKQVVWLLAIVWALQGATGMAFGAASYWFYGALPDLHQVGVGALGTKVVCAILAFGLCIWLLRRLDRLKQIMPWSVLTLLAATAAAVLRWNS